MRLVSFGAPGREKPGVLLDQRILDLAGSDPTLPGDLRAILAADRLGDIATLLHAGAAPHTFVPLAGTRLGPPIPNPSKIVCIGLNYADHAAEQDQPDPQTIASKSMGYIKGILESLS